MGNQKSKTEEVININNNSPERSMDFGTTIKIDAFCILCLGVIIFLVFKLNKYFKSYVKKVVVQV